MRPDLSQGALSNEDDLQSGQRVADQLTKEANDAMMNKMNHDNAARKKDGLRFSVYGFQLRRAVRRMAAPFAELHRKLKTINRKLKIRMLLILCHLQDVDAVWLCQRLRQTDPDRPVLIVSMDELLFAREVRHTLGRGAMIFRLPCKMAGVLKRTMCQSLSIGCITSIGCLETNRPS